VNLSHQEGPHLMQTAGDTYFFSCSNFLVKLSASRYSLCDSLSYMEPPMREFIDMVLLAFILIFTLVYFIFIKVQ